MKAKALYYSALAMLAALATLIAAAGIGSLIEGLTNG